MKTVGGAILCGVAVVVAGTVWVASKALLSKGKEEE